jgi:protein-S-isoprenylcysteine O-methyltransferase Ste14
MISFPLLILVLCNFIAIGLLPVFFFRGDGSYNLRWLAVGAPFFIVPVGLLAGQFGLLDPLYVAQGAILQGAQLIAVVFSAISIALIAMTVGGHRVPLALWHQDNDAPAQIVTWGAYARVRHPFYTSFLLAFAAGVLAFPHGVTIGFLVYSLISLSVTAKGEEQRLSESEFGQEYRDYIKITGRFFPRLVS